MQVSDNAKCNLMRKISELEFAIIEITLYLDNHPNDTGALSRIKSAIADYNKYYQEYISTYGPIKAIDMPLGDRWLWGEQNFPWDV